MTVSHAIANVILELPAIGKDSQMGGSQGYRYRGVEAIKAALKGPMARAGVHYTPHDIVDAQFSEFAVKSGSVWQRCRLTVRFRVYGPDGDFVEAVTVGEGTDAGDKSANKAMTAAEKYALPQVFAICDAGADDPDHSLQPEQAAGWSPNQVKGGVLTEILKRLDVSDVKGKELAAAAWKVVGDGRAEWSPADGEAVIEACVVHAESSYAAEALEGVS